MSYIGLVQLGIEGQSDGKKMSIMGTGYYTLQSPYSHKTLGQCMFCLTIGIAKVEGFTSI
jgi:hypothetical protein